MRAVSVWTTIRLPYAKRAYIPQPPTHRFNKLKDYALNPDHPDGGPKAAWFRSCLGIVQDDWEYLHDQILGRLPACRLACKPRYKFAPAEPDPGLRVGFEFEVHIPIEGRNQRRALTVAAWRLDARLAPFLTTIYPP